MRRIKGFKLRFKRLKLAQKLTLMNMVVILVPTVVFLIVAFNFTKAEAIKEQQKNLEIEMSKSSGQIEKNIEACYLAAQVMLNNGELIEKLEGFKSLENIGARELIEFNNNEVRAMERIANSNLYLYQIRFYTKMDQLLEMMPVIYDDKRLGMLEWYDANHVYKNEWQLNFNNTLFRDSVTQPDVQVGALVNTIYDSNNEYLGVLEVSARMETLLPELYTTSKKNWTGFMTGETLLYDAESEMSQEWVNYKNEILSAIDWTHQEEQYVVQKINDAQMIIGYKPIKQLGGGLIKAISIEDELKVLTNTQNIGIFLVFLLVALLTLIANKISSIVLRSFYRMIDVMEEVQKGNLDVKVPDVGHDEVAEFGKNFEKMIHRLKDLMHDKVQKEISVKDSEIRALQNQINAHFIYNVLESIKMMAEIEEKYEISDAVTALGKLLRYSMKWHSPQVTVREEIEYIKNYLSLLNLRYDYKILLAVKISPIHMDTRIPKMSLQPIVENAVYHGIEDLAEDTTISIKGIVRDEKFIIEITNMGKGMSDAQIEVFMQKLSGKIIEEKKSSNGIGLKNVQDRIHLCYGDAYGISVAAKEDCFTKVSVSVPLNQNMMEGKKDE